jgi:WD40 repeat protein/V8-like Glu-specific endopeptidase
MSRVWVSFGAIIAGLLIGVLAMLSPGVNASVKSVISIMLSYLPGLGSERVVGTLAFPLSEFRNPVPGTPQGVLATAESAVSPNFQRVVNLPGESIRRPARGVGQLRIHLKGEKAFSTCTAFLIDQEHLLTAAHCLAGSESDNALRQMQSENRALAPIEEITVHFSYLDTQKEYQGIGLEVETKPSEYDPVWSRKMDYVVLKLKAGEAERAKQAGYELEILTLGDVPLKAKQGFYILHYPKGDPLTLTRNFCKAVDKDPPTLENPYEFGHSCDTVPGSSGAPIFSEEHDAVIGIHVCCAYVSRDRFAESCVQCNIGINLADIAKHSSTINKLIKTKLLTRREKLLVARADILAELSDKQLEKHDYVLAGKLALAALKPLIEPSAEVQTDATKRVEQLRDADERLFPAAVNAQGALARAIVENPLLKVLRLEHTSIVAFSGDGTRMVTVLPDKTARLWDASSGTELRVLRGHEGNISSVAFSRDGTRIVTGSYDKTARIWDARSGAELKVLRGHEESVESIAISDDGTRIVTGSSDRTARLWDALTGVELKLSQGAWKLVTSVAISGDGNRIAIGTSEGSAWLWDARIGSDLIELSAHEDRVTSVAFSGDGTRIVTGSFDMTARLWDARSGTELKVLRGHEWRITSVAFSSDGRRIVTGSGDGTARLWDARSGAELKILSGGEGSVSFSGDSKRVITVDDDGAARFWDALGGAELKVLDEHFGKVSSVAFSGDGTRIVTGSWDYLARLWDSDSGDLRKVLQGRDRFVDLVAISRDGTRIVSASFLSLGDSANTAGIWDAGSGAELKVLRGHEKRITSAGFSPDGTRIVTGSSDKTARIWDAKSGAELKVLRGHEGSVESIAISDDGARVVTGSADKTVRVWDARSGAELKVLIGHEGTIVQVAFVGDGSRIVTASSDNTVRLWNARSGAELEMVRGVGGNFVAFSADGTRMVTAADKTARVLDARSGAVLAVLRGHENEVTSVAISRDGTRIVTGSSDKTARIWEAPRALPTGSALVDEAAKSIELLSSNECVTFPLACSAP